MVKLVNKSLTSQVRSIIRERISKSEFMSKLPSEQELAQELGVSRNTVREALKALETEGLLVSRHGVGTFVISYSDDKSAIKYNLALLDSTTRIIAESGCVPGTQSIFFDQRVAPAQVAEKLGGVSPMDVLYVERVRTADGEPVVFVEDYIAYIPGMIEDFSEKNSGPLFDFMNHYMPVSFANASLHAVISDERLMGKLKLDKPKALLKLQQVHYSDKGKPIIYSDSYFITEKLEFNLVRRCIE